MKIVNFSFSVRPFRGQWGFDRIKELVYRIDLAGGKVLEYREAVHADFLPDDQSFLDYLFDHAKSEFKKHSKVEKK